MLGAGFQFEWDEFNEGHVWDGHQVTAAEVEEAYYDDEPVFTQNHPPHRASHIMYGYSAAGVLIVAPFGPARRGEENWWRVATAWHGEPGDYELYDLLLKRKSDDQTKRQAMHVCEDAPDGTD